MVETSSAFFFRKSYAGQSQLRRFANQLAREFPGFVQFLSQGLYFRLRELSHRLLQQQLFFAEFQIHAGFPRAQFKQSFGETILSPLTIHCHIRGASRCEFITLGTQRLLQSLVGHRQVFWVHARLTRNGHEVRIAKPPWQSV
jgi:hypothetical protein